MRGLVAFNLWQWIDDNRATFEPPVGNKVIWEDSQFTAMVVRGPNARRDFHVDPSAFAGVYRLTYEVLKPPGATIKNDSPGTIAGSGIPDASAEVMPLISSFVVVALAEMATRRSSSR